MEEFETNQHTEENIGVVGFDFTKYLRGLWKRKWLILALIIIFAIPFYQKAKNEVPIFEARVILATKELKDQEQLLNESRRVEMRSRTFASRVAAQMGLAVVSGDSIFTRWDQIFSERHTSEDPVPGAYKIVINPSGNYYLYYKDGLTNSLIDSALVWDAVESVRSVNGFSFRLNPELVQKAQTINFKVVNFLKAVNEIKNGLTARPGGSWIVLSMQGTDPDMLYKNLNQIAEIYIQETLKLKFRDSNNYRDMLQKQLDAAENRLNSHEKELRAFNAKYPTSLEVEKLGLVDKLKDLDAALERLPRERNQLSDLLDQLDKDQNMVEPKQYRSIIVKELANLPVFANEPTLKMLKETLTFQEKKYLNLLQTYSEEYPALKDLDSQINDTQEKIISFASKYRNTLVERETEYRRQLDETETQLKTFPEEDFKYAELMRNKEISEKLYTYLYTELQKSELSDAAQSDGIRILDPAIRPNSPINSSPKIKVFLGVLLGLLCGIFISIVIDLFDKKIRIPEDIERHLKLPVLGAIPIIDFKNIPEFHDFEKVKQIDRQLVTHDYSPTQIGEAYRALRTHLMFSKKTGRIHTLLLTSISPEEGKSFTASNLAIILAQQKTNTLLVDADLRRGVLHNTFSMSKDPGITNYLVNKSTLADVVQPTHIPNLSIISCGSMIPNPSELLGSLQMRRFLEETRRKFDVIVFDAPPLEAATDSVVLGTQMDAVAIVARAGKTNYKVVKEKLEIFDTVPVNLIGMILNGSKTTMLKNSYSYYHY